MAWQPTSTELYVEACRYTYEAYSSTTLVDIIIVR